MRNLIEDIKFLVQVVKNIKLIYYSRSANKLVDMIVKKAHVCCINYFFCNGVFGCMT